MSYNSLDFIEFAFREDIGQQFACNITNHGYNMDMLRVLNLPDWMKVSHAFCWEDTPEGFDFWNDLNKKWHSERYNTL